MSDSAGRFTDLLSTRPAADRERAVNEVSGNGFQTAAADAARQAAAGEARVIGVNQDRATSAGVADAASGQATQRAGIAMPPGDGPQFTRDPQ
jgi:hypothetical protein